MTLIPPAHAFRAHGTQRHVSHSSGRRHDASPQNASSGQKVLTVATLNCENVFLGPPDPGQDTESQPPKSPAAMASVARAIVNTGADVIALQEIHDKKALDTLVDTYMTGNPYPHRVLVPGNDGRGINVAVLSKYPITRVESNAGDRFPVGRRKEGFARDFLETTIKVSDRFEFVLGTAHLKSHGGGWEADRKRLAEGRHIRKLLVEEMERYPQRGYIIAGDLNDTEKSPPVKAIVGKGPSRLYDPLQGTREISHPPTNRRIDYLLMSDNMRQIYVDDSAEVRKDPEAEEGTDHRAVIAKFEIPGDTALRTRSRR